MTEFKFTFVFPDGGTKDSADMNRDELLWVIENLVSEVAWRKEAFKDMADLAGGKNARH